MLKIPFILWSPPATLACQPLSLVPISSSASHCAFDLSPSLPLLTYINSSPPPDIEATAYVDFFTRPCSCVRLDPFGDPLQHITHSSSGFLLELLTNAHSQCLVAFSLDVFFPLEVLQYSLNTVFWFHTDNLPEMYRHAGTSAAYTA